MAKMPRLGGSHTLAELEALAHKQEADARAATQPAPNPPAPAAQPDEPTE